MRLHIANQLMLLLLLCLLVSCSPFISGPSTRNTVTQKRIDGITVTCIEPPPDVIAKAGDFNVKLAMEKTEALIKASIGGRIETERIREIIPDVNAFEVVQFRLCIDYGNGVLTPDEYKRFLKEILPVIKPQVPEPLSWKEVDIVERIAGRTNYPKASWTDIFWIDESEGWLSGVLEEGGGGRDVGRGILLRTKTGGITWSEVPKANFESGQGEFRWAPCTIGEPKELCEKHYLYRWKEVGPIKSMLFYRPTGEEKIKGFLAATTGIYATEDNGENWKRTTPKPNDQDGYAHFSHIADIEGLHEIYAVGWQGIAHWPDLNGKWKLQWPTYSYAIFSVFVGPDREIWAVGHAPNVDKRVYQGAIYYLAPRSAKWEIVPLIGIELEFDQSLTDILLTDYTTALVIGQKGLILRGVRNKSGGWAWSKIPSGTKETLNSVIYANNKLWIVGNGGVILDSVDKGEHWNKILTIKDKQGAAFNLNRVRFFGPTGWIVGNGVIMKLATAP